MFFTIWLVVDVLLVFIFFCETIFSFYLVAWLGAVSNVSDNCLFMKFPGLLHVFSLVYELLFNTFVRFFSKIHEFIICIEEICNHRICIHFSAFHEKIKNSDGPPGRSPFALKTKLGLIPVIMLQIILIVHLPPVSVIIRNNFRILELD